MRVMTAAVRSATTVSALLIGLTNAHAQTAFMSVNGGGQLASNDFTHEVTFSFAVLPNRFANLTDKAEYPVGNTAAFDVAGGVYVTRNIGVGAAFTLVKQNEQASLTSEIPDFGVGPIHRTGMTAFDRSERGIHIQLMGIVPVHDRLTLCFFGGPSFVAVTQDVIAQVGFGSFVVPRQELDDTAWGFNVGGDVAWFFTNNIGIGGGVRLTRATVEFPNLLRETASPSGNAGNPPFLEGERRVESDAGGAQLTVGMRFRFP
jgi:outer membrane protein with beta-barrel domain